VRPRPSQAEPVSGRFYAPIRQTGLAPSERHRAGSDGKAADQAGGQSEKFFACRPSAPRSPNHDFVSRKRAGRLRSACRFLLSALESASTTRAIILLVFTCGLARSCLANGISVLDANRSPFPLLPFLFMSELVTARTPIGSFRIMCCSGRGFRALKHASSSFQRGAPCP